MMIYGLSSKNLSKSLDLSLTDLIDAFNDEGNNEPMISRADKGRAKRLKEGRKVRRLRNYLGLSQNELGRLADLTAQQISNIETGQRGIGPDIGPRLAKVFSLSEKEFRRLLNEDNDDFTVLWMELHQTQGAEDLIDCFRNLLRIKRAANQASRPETLELLQRQIELMALLSKE